MRLVGPIGLGEVIGTNDWCLVFGCGNFRFAERGKGGASGTFHPLRKFQEFLK